MNSKQEFEEQLKQLSAENTRLTRENVSLRQRLVSPGQRKTTGSDKRAENAPITHTSGTDEKIRLFRKLFRGRENVYPVRWENRNGKTGYSPACGNEWHKVLCGKPKVKCGQCKNSQFLPVTDQVIHDHLSGKQTIGVYPILENGFCWFLAVDFDKSNWRADVGAFLGSCRQCNIPAYAERSRSGEGGHIWIFFRNAIPAWLARKLGTHILTHTMAHRPQVGLDSYDRFFPSQDTLPKGGFGNLIALPLQQVPRGQGNSVFLDQEMRPIIDQWSYLAGIQRTSREQVENIVESAGSDDEVLRIRRVSILDEALEDPWTLVVSKRVADKPLAGDMPTRVRVVLSNQLFIEKDGLPPALQNELIRLAAFQNPEFYRAQAMRMSTHGKPRLIACADDYPLHIGLPRGCLSSAISLLKAQNIEVDVEDERYAGTLLEVEFKGQLRLTQPGSCRRSIATRHRSSLRAYRFRKDGGCGKDHRST